MHRTKFEKELNLAVSRAKEAVSDLILLPSRDCFIVAFNMSNDDNHEDFERVYIEDDCRLEYFLNLQESAKVLDKDGRYPVWINVTVCSVDAENTYIELLCSGRYVYYSKQSFSNEMPLNICAKYSRCEETQDRILCLSNPYDVVASLVKRAQSLTEAKRDRGWGI